MLVLTRKEGEVIDILAPGGQKLSIMLVEVARGKVRLGISADKQFAIYRRELLEPNDREDSE